MSLRTLLLAALCAAALPAAAAETRSGTAAAAAGPAPLPALAAAVRPDDGAPARAPARMVPPLAAGTKRHPAPPAEAAAGEPAVVDVLVAYTQDAVDFRGSEAAMLARIAYLESLTNRVYRDSDAGTTIRVVGTMKVDYSYEPSDEDALVAISVPSALPVKAQIDARRDAVGADLVVLVRTHMSVNQFSCGAGWWLGYHGAPFRSDYAYSVVSDGGHFHPDYSEIDCRSPLGFATQLGHNLGAGADKYTPSSTASDDHGAWEFSRASRFNDVLAFDDWQTVGTYLRGTFTVPFVDSVLPLLSNPDLTCKGRPCGIDGYSDNARTLRLAAPIVAGFRVTKIAMPTGVLSVGDAEAVEGDSGRPTLAFTVSLAAPLAVPVSFTARALDDTATAGADFEATSVQVTIPAGQTSVQVPVAVLPDPDAEGDEVMQLQVYDVVNARAAIGYGTGTIREDDAAVVLRQANLLEGDAGATMMRVVAELTAPAEREVRLTISTAARPDLGQDAATPGSDYVETAKTFWIPAGSRRVELLVPVNGDDVPEPHELFVASVSGVTGAPVKVASVWARIVDDEAYVEAVVDNEVEEGSDGWYDHGLWVGMQRRMAEPVAFTVRTKVGQHPGGTLYGVATPGEDYEAAEYSGVIPAGEAGVRLPFLVNGDTLYEPLYETVALELAVPGHATAPPYQFLIKDDEPSPVPTRLGISDTQPSEGYYGTRPTATVRVSLYNERFVTENVTFKVRLVPGTATPGVDYVDFGVREYEIGAWFPVKMIDIEIIGDGDVEPDETFFVEVFDVVGAETDDLTATVTLLNDDLPVSLSIADVRALEGNAGDHTELLFRVAPAIRQQTLVTGDIAVEYIDAGTGDVTYDGHMTHFVFSFPYDDDDEMFRTVGVRITPDALPEADERIRVRLVNVVGASITDGEAIGTIVDDDSEPPTPIGAIQGRGPTSPLAGRAVLVEGVVTASTQRGFFLQSLVADADPLTAEGLFVDLGGTGKDIDVGNRVWMRGTVRELSEPGRMRAAAMTALQADVLYERLPVPLPEPVAIDATKVWPGLGIGLLEPLEGMRVVLPAARVVGAADGRPDGGFGGDYCRFDVVPDLLMRRPFRGAGLHPQDMTPMPAGVAPPRNDGNVERLRVRTNATLTWRGYGTCATADAGDTITGLTGVLDYGEGAFRLLTDPEDNLPARIRSGLSIGRAPPPAAGEVSIGLIDVDRIFDVQDTDGIDDGENLDMSNQVRHLGTQVCDSLGLPDVVAVLAVENHTILEYIADGIRTRMTGHEAQCPEGTDYAEHSLPSTSPDSMDVGLLVNRATLPNGSPRVAFGTMTAVGAGETFRHPDASTTPLFGMAPVRVDLTVNAAGAPFPLTLLVLRFEPDAGIRSTAAGTRGWADDGARVRARRIAQAAFVARWVDALQAAEPARRILVTGDFQAGDHSDGIGDLRGVLTGTEPAATQVLTHSGVTMAKPLHDLDGELEAGQRYNAVVDGEALALDHMLVNAALRDSGLALRVVPVRINADISPEASREPSTSMGLWRRDPLVAYLSAPAAAGADLYVTTGDGARPTANAAARPLVVNVYNDGPERALEPALLVAVNLPPTAVKAKAPAGWTCAVAAAGAGAEVGCQSDVPLEAGAKVAIELRLSPPPASAGGLVRAGIEATATSPDPKPLNNRDDSYVRPIP